MGGAEAVATEFDHEALRIDPGLRAHAPTTPGAVQLPGVAVQHRFARAPGEVAASDPALGGMTRIVDDVSVEDDPALQWMRDRFPFTRILGPERHPPRSGRNWQHQPAHADQAIAEQWVRSGPTHDMDLGALECIVVGAQQAEAGIEQAIFRTQVPADRPCGQPGRWHDLRLLDTQVGRLRHAEDDDSLEGRAVEDAPNRRFQPGERHAQCERTRRDPALGAGPGCVVARVGVIDAHHQRDRLWTVVLAGDAQLASRREGSWRIEAFDVQRTARLHRQGESAEHGQQQRGGDGESS